MNTSYVDTGLGLGDAYTATSLMVPQESIIDSILRWKPCGVRRLFASPGSPAPGTVEMPEMLFVFTDPG